METFCQRIVIFAFTLHFRVDAATQASQGQVRGGAGQGRTGLETQLKTEDFDSRLRLRLRLRLSILDLLSLPIKST